MNLDKEIMLAKEVRKRAYCPYTKYYVGASLKCKSGKIYTGCNIQNHGIMSICAERVAFLKALSEGEKEFECIVVCGGPNLDKIENCTPCGYCRQFISEFVDDKFKIYIVTEDSSIKEYSIFEMLPHRFEI